MFDGQDITRIRPEQRAAWDGLCPARAGDLPAIDGVGKSQPRVIGPKGAPARSQTLCLNSFRRCRACSTAEVGSSAAGSNSNWRSHGPW